MLFHGAKLNRWWQKNVAVLILAGAGIASIAIIAYAQEMGGIVGEPTEGEIAAQGIAFPVPELENCVDKNACRDFCNQPQNMSACIVFAHSHGLMTEKESVRAEKFATKVQRGETPGGCRGPRECAAYCSNVEHIDECLAFAEKEGIKTTHIEQAKKIRDYVKGGGQLPGGCASRVSCEEYCSNFGHAKECFAFGKRIGIQEELARDTRTKGPGGEEFESITEFEKLAELAAKGETPGGCASKKECETYCQTPDHQAECLAFGVKVGFIKPEQKEQFEKFLQTGGPGGCRDRASCEVYCNETVNQESCFAFAKEHGFLSEENLERAKEGMVRLRAGLEQTSEEVRECMKSVLGPHIIEDIQSGTLVPGPEIGERMRSCFERFGGEHRAEKLFANAPAKVKQCLTDKLGAGALEKVTKGVALPSPEMADTFRICFQSDQLERALIPHGGGDDGFPGRQMPILGEMLRSAPSEISACLKEKLGERFAGIASGEVSPGPEMGIMMHSCLDSFRPSQQMFDTERGEFRNIHMMPPSSGIREGSASRFPPEVITCV